MKTKTLLFISVAFCMLLLNSMKTKADRIQSLGIFTSIKASDIIWPDFSGHKEHRIFSKKTYDIGNYCASIVEYALNNYNYRKENTSVFGLMISKSNCFTWPLLTGNEINTDFCIPLQSYDTNCLMWISNITTSGGIFNLTNSSACADSSYEDFCGTDTAKYSQLSYAAISFTSSGYAMTFSVWIDFNDDYIFDSTERVIANENAEGAFTFTDYFAIPLDAAPGTHRMRIRGDLNGNGAPANPCDQLQNGETEDYSFTVIAAVPCSGAPNPGNTISTADSVCPIENFTLSLQNSVAATGIAYQWQSSTDSTTWTDITGDTSAIMTTSQTVSSYYRCEVICTNDLSMGYSNPVYVFMNELASCYCIPPVSDYACSYEWITSVTTSGGESDINSNTVCSSSSYADFTGSDTLSNFQFGYTSMSFTSYDYGLAFSVWIDYNDNGIFEAPEKVISNDNPNGALTVTDNFTVPGSGALGTHRMRIRGEDYWYGAPDDPCDQLEYGETEDYAFTILQALQKDVKMASIIKPDNNVYQLIPSDVSVQIKNNGIDTLTQVPLTYIFNLQSPVLYTWNGQLLPQHVVSVDMPQITASDSSNSFTVYSSLAGDLDNTNDTMSFNFVALPPPARIHVGPDTVFATITSCDSAATQTASLMIENTGYQSLNYLISQEWCEDFETGLNKWIADDNWGVIYPGYNGGYGLTESPSGDYNNYWDKYIQLKDSLFITDKDSSGIQFMLKRNLENSYDYIRTQISVNGGGWNTISEFTGYEDWSLKKNSISSYVENGDYIKFRFWFHSDVSVIYDGVVIDDLKIKGIENNWAILSKTTDTVATGDSSSVDITFIVGHLNAGNYSQNLTIGSNDPFSPFVIIPLNFTIIGYPQILVKDSIRVFPSVFAGVLASDSFMIYNTGCDSLIITAVNNADSAFIPVFPPYILGKDSALIAIDFSSLTMGLHSDTLTILSNSETKRLYVSGTILPTPHIVLAPDTIYATTTCDDSVTLPLTIYNTGSGDLSYFIDTTGGIGDTSILVIQEGTEWNVDMQTFIQNNYGITPTKISSSQIAATDFSLYNIIITAGNQNSTYYNNISTNKTKFEIFVNNGGIIQYQLANYNGITINLAGGVNASGGNAEDENTSLLTTHPIVSGLPVTLLGNDANSGYFTNLPGNTKIITETKTSLQPTTVEYEYGKGLVIATTMTWGYLYTNGYNSGPLLPNATAYSMSQINLYPRWLTLSSDSGLIAPGDSAVIDLIFNSTGLNADIYSDDLTIQTNDPLSLETITPLYFTVTGSPQILVNDSVMVFASIMAGETAIDTFKICNTGCDSLKITGINNADSAFTPGFPSLILPRDSGIITINFSSMIQGQHSDTLTILNNSETKHLYVSGAILPTPQLVFVPDTISLSTNICYDTIVTNMLVINTGNDTMSWNAYYSDGAGSSLYFNGNNGEAHFGDLGLMTEKGSIEFWMKTNVNSGTKVLYSSSGINTNWKGVNIYQSGTYLYLRMGDDNASYYTFTITTNVDYTHWHHVAVTWDKTQNKVWTYFDGNVTTNGSYNPRWVTAFSDVRLGIGYSSSTSYHFNGEIDGFRLWSENRPAAGIINLYHESIFAPSASLTGLWEFNEPSGDSVYSFNSGIKGVLYNTSRVNSGALIRDPQIDADPVYGLLADGDTTDVEVTFIVDGFNSGSHNSLIRITTNDPLHQAVIVPTQLVLNGSPQVVFNDSIRTFPSIMVGALVADTFKIYNTGCDSLKITGINNADSAFTPGFPSLILPGDSGIITVNFSSMIQGQHSDTLTILNNSETRRLYVSGTILQTPHLVFVPDTIFVSTNICIDTIITTLQVINTGNDTLDWNAYCSNGAGNSLSFNGSTSEVHFGNFGLMPDKGCVEFWMKTNVNTGSRRVFSSSGLNSNYKGINIYQSGTNLYLIIGNDAGSYGSSYTITTNVGYGNWHHVAVTWDRTQNKVWTYFDGNVNANGSSNAYWPTAFSDVRLGIGYSTSASYHFSGELDEFRMWSVNRSAADILNFYKEAVFPPPAGLTGLWEFNEPAGDTVYSFNSGEKGVLLNTIRVNSLAPINDPQIEADPVSGALAGGDTTDVEMTFFATGFNSGMHNSVIGITTNDPLHTFVVVPTQLVLTGPPQIAINDSIDVLPSIMAGDFTTSTFTIFNTGCDSLLITAVNNTDTAFTPVFPSFILPKDSGIITVNFYSLTQGLHADTLTILSNSNTMRLYVSGTILPTPELILAPDSVPVSTNSCVDTIVATLQLINTGNDTLDWNAYYSIGAGKSLSFNGSTSEVHFGNFGQMPDKGCVEFWMKTNVNTGSRRVFSSSGLNSNNKGINIYQSGSYLYLIIGNDAGSYYTTYTITTNVGYGNWHHVAVTWDKTQNKVWTYFDGNVNANGSYNSYWPTAFSDVRLGIGYSTSASYHFSGELDEFQIWSVNRSAAEINNYFHESVFAPSAGLTGLWEFNEASGDTVYSFNSNKQGVLVNATRVNSAAPIHSPQIEADIVSGLLPGGDTATVAVTFYTGGFNNGIHNSVIAVNTNDPLHPLVFVPTQLVLNGLPQIVLGDSIGTFHSIMAGSTAADTFMIYNTGCDSLIISSLNHNNAAFTPVYPPYLLPRDSGQIIVNFYSLTQAVFYDTITIVSNSETAHLYVWGATTPTPAIDVEPDNIVVSTNNCVDPVVSTLQIINTGNDTLACSYYFSESLTDNFNNGVDNTQWSSVSNGVAANSCGTAAGNNALYFNGSGTREAITKPFNTMGGGVIAFYLKFGTGSSPCEDADGGEDVVLEYSVSNGATWVNIQTYYNDNYPVFTAVQAQIPAGAQSMTALIRWRQLSHSGSGYDNWSIDEVSINGTGGVWASLSDTTGSALPGDTSLLDITFGTGLSQSGTYYQNLVVESNDPLNPIIVVPMSFTINGLPQILIEDSIRAFPDIMAGVTATDTFMVYNTGCDSLMITAVNNVDPAFTTVFPPYIIPGDSGIISVSLYSLVPGLHNDTLTILNNSETKHLYVTATILVIPEITVIPDSIVVSTNICYDTITSTLQVINTGDDTLTCSYYFSEGIADNFDNGIDNAEWSSILGCVSSSLCGTAAGSNALYFDGSGSREIVTESFNAMGGGTISFYLKIATGSSPCENADAGEDVVLEYSVDNGASWAIIQTYYSENFPDFTSVQAQIPAAAQSLNTLIRWRQIAHSGSGFDNWIIDEVEINGMGGSWATLSDTTDVVIPGDTSLIDITFIADQLYSGTYFQNLVVESNDPLTPFVIVPLYLTITGSPQILITDSIEIFPSIYAGETATDTFKIYNTGCDSLKITAVNNVDPAFTPVFPSMIMPRDSGIITVSFYSPIQGLRSDTLTVLNNSETRLLYVSGTILPTPQLSVTTDSLLISTTNCDDTIISNLQVINTGNDTLSWNAYYSMGAGNALSFNGSTSEVFFGNYGPMLQRGSVEFWMKSNTGSGQRSLFSSSGLNNNWKGINIYQYSNYVYLRIGADNGDSYTTYTITDNINAGNWHHVAVTWDILQNKVWTYFDGNIVTNGSYNPYWPSTISDVRLGIGYSSSYHFYGQIDELRIWGETRTGANIRDLYQEPFVSISEDLVGLWEFNESSGDTVYSFDHNKNGILSNVTRVASGADIKKIGIDVVPGSGTVPAGDSVNVQLTLITAGLNNGHHYGGIGISSNDPLHEAAVIPVHLVLSGNPELQLLATELYLDSIVAGATISDSIQFFNFGCDTLNVTDITHNDTNFSINQTSFTLLPGGTAKLIVTFSPVYAGIYNDTIQFISDGGNQQLFVHAFALAPPLASVTISNSSFDPCQDSVITCTAIPANGGTNPLYQWYVNDSLMLQEYEINNGDIFTYTPLDNDSIMCVMTSNLPYVVNNPDTSNMISVAVPPLVIPDSAGMIAGMTIVCQGQNNVIYTVPVILNATYYIWTLPSGATGTSVTNSITLNYSNIAVSGNISVKGHNFCADGAESILAITVNPLPENAGLIAGITTVCQGQNNVVYTVPAIANATSYIWTLPSGATGTSTTNSIAVNYGPSAISGNIIVKGHNSCGDGPSSSLAVTVALLPVSAGSISGPANICISQDSVTYTVPVIANATSYIWTLPFGVAGTSSTNSILVNFSDSSATGNITVRGANACGNGAVSTKLVLVDSMPLPAGQINGDNMVCRKQNNVSYTIPVIANATSYVWTLPPGATGTSATNSIVVNYSDTAISGNISVKGLNFCGGGTESYLVITVNPLPVVNAGTDTIINQGSSVALNGSITGGSQPYTILWAPSGSLSDNDIINPLANPVSSTTYILTGADANGCSASDNAHVAVVYVATGSVVYNNAFLTPMQNEWVYLENSLHIVIDSVLTTGAGNYYFDGIGNGTHYLYSKPAYLHGGINSTDALVIRRHIVHLATLGGVNLNAADVNNSSTVSSADALQVVRRTIGLMSTFAAGDWTSEIKSVNITSNVQNELIRVLCMGDVNGSYNIYNLKATDGSPELTCVPATTNLIAGETFDLPIRVNQNIVPGALTLYIQFPDDLLDIINVSLNGSEIEYNISNGVLSIGAYDENGMVLNDNVLLSVKCKIKPDAVNNEVCISLLNQCEIADKAGTVLKGIQLEVARLNIAEKYDGFKMEDNVPNPFAATTKVRIYVPEEATVDLSVLNMHGIEIKTISYSYLSPGWYEIQIDGKDFAQGVYFYHIHAVGLKNTFEETRRMMILR